MKAYENQKKASMKRVFNKYSKDRENTLICKVSFFSMGLLKVYQSSSFPASQQYLSDSPGDKEQGCFDAEKPKKAPNWADNRTLPAPKRRETSFLTPSNKQGLVCGQVNDH